MVVDIFTGYLTTMTPVQTLLTRLSVISSVDIKHKTPLTLRETISSYQEDQQPALLNSSVLEFYQMWSMLRDLVPRMELGRCRT